MKLLRMTTIREDAFFDVAVPELKIEPKSKIALLNASFDTELEGIIIDENNNGVKMTVNSQGNEILVILTKGTYNDTNYEDLLNDISFQFNNQLSYAVNAERGVEVNCSVDSGNHVVLGYRNAKWLTESSSNVNQVLKLVEDTRSETNATFNSTLDFAKSTNNSFMYSKQYIAKGTGQIACRCKTLNRGGEELFKDGFIIGLTDVDMRTYNESLFNPDNYLLAIKCEADGQPIKFKIKGEQFQESQLVSNPSNPTLNNRDSVALRVSDGLLEAVVHQEGDQGDGTIIALTNYDNNKKLYPVIIFRGSTNNTAIDQVKSYYSPYNNNSGIEHPILTGVSPTKRLGTTLTNNSISFTNQEGAILNPDLARFLGFDLARYPKTGFTKSSNYEIKADNQFDFSNLSDAYLIEMLNIPITSWDGETSKKRSILSVIPVSNDKDPRGLVQYEANTPIFLDIDNMSPMLMRNIQCRIIKNDTSTLLLRGLASLTILIKSPDEGF